MPISDRTQRKRNVKREDILDCAQRLLRAEGYDNFTMQDIADAADISKGSLYLHFSNKETLFAAVIARSFDRLTALVREETQAGGTGMEKVERIARGAWRFYEENPDLLANLQLTSRVISMNAPSDLEFIASHFKDIRSIIGKIFEEGARDGSLRSDLDAATLIPLFIILMNSFLEKLAQLDIQKAAFLGVTPKRLVEEFFAILVSYVQPTRAGKGGKRA